MALLTSPIDGSPMRQINRYGIEIDVCPSTGGIWLDKGELEKLIALIKEETANTSYPSLNDDHRRGDHKYSQRDYDDDDNDKHYDRRYKRKSKMSRIMDVFDF